MEVIQVIVKIDLSHENIERITSERLMRLNMDTSNHFYDMDFIENLEENDEIDVFESGFMSGYLNA